MGMESRLALGHHMVMARLILVVMSIVISTVGLGACAQICPGITGSSPSEQVRVCALIKIKY